MPKGLKGFQRGHKDFRTVEGIKRSVRKLAMIPRSTEWKKKIGESNKRAFAEGRKSVRGSKNPSWKGGITPEIHMLRKSLEYMAWRNEVYRRDGWSCRICRQRLRKGNIIAHHLKLFSDFPELRFSVDNGVTLCRSCHKHVHNGKKEI